METGQGIETNKGNPSEAVFGFIAEYLQKGDTEFPFALNQVSEIPENVRDFTDAKSLWLVPKELRNAVYEAFMRAAFLPAPVRAIRMNALHILNAQVTMNTGRTVFAFLDHNMKEGQYIGASSALVPLEEER